MQLRTKTQILKSYNQLTNCLDMSSYPFNEQTIQVIK
jgi:hypothetical protein